MLENIIKVLGILLIITILSVMWGVGSYVSENGGVKETIIHLGKEMKDIGQQIGKG